MAHFAAAAVVSGMASAAGATGVVAAAGFDRRGRARGPGGGEAGGPPGVKPSVNKASMRARAPLHVDVGAWLILWFANALRCKSNERLTT